jgi:serine/alanine adding enzyme
VYAERFDGTAEQWDSFVLAEPGWTSFHRYAWRPLLKSVYGLECPFLCARDDSGSIRGVLPLVRVQSKTFGHYLISMPFVSYGGPLGSEDAVRALSSEAATMAKREGADLMEMRSPHALPLDLLVSHRKVTSVLSLSGGAEAVLKALPAKVRSQTRRPFKEGIEVRFGQEVVGDFHSVYSRHMRDLGTPAQPRGFFEGIATYLPEDAWFGVVYLKGQPIAGGAGFRWRDEFEITWASTLREHNRISANMGLYWAFIERAANDGASRFNFGRCTPGSATHKFKQQWGALDEPLWWYQSGRAGGAPSADSAKFRLATRIWQRLPVPVARAMSGRIVRYLP